MSMIDAVASFDARCKRLPKKLREWDACVCAHTHAAVPRAHRPHTACAHRYVSRDRLCRYNQLRSAVSNLQDLLPLLAALTRPCVKPRHWQTIVEITKRSFAIDSDAFRLEVLLDADLVTHKETVEDVCDAAEKQAAIEAKLDDITHAWSVTEFEFSRWRARDVRVLKGHGGVSEALEESLMSLQTMLAMRHVVPFKELVARLLAVLSNASDTLDFWVKVQTAWMSLEPVFTGGDIAKQMPLEAKKFTRIDKDFVKVMAKSEELRTVVAACSNELLINALPVMLVELEKCQKSLEGYLEAKRGKFPRFYFVSNPVLLAVLSQGSDPLAVQPFYEKLFDSIGRVVHDKVNARKITHMWALMGDDHEAIALSAPVAAGVCMPICVSRMRAPRVVCLMRIRMQRGTSRCGCGRWSAACSRRCGTSLRRSRPSRGRSGCRRWSRATAPRWPCYRCRWRGRKRARRRSSART